jgi:hypothetical protein
MDPETQHTSEQFVRVTNLICFAIMMSVPIYMVVAWILVAQGGLGTRLENTVATALAVAAGGLLVGARVVFDRLKAAAAAKSTVSDRLAAYRTAAIIAFAMREGIAIIGLMVTLLGGDLRWAFGFGAIAMLAMLIGWPKKAEMVRLASDSAAAPIG